MGQFAGFARTRYNAVVFNADAVGVFIIIAQSGNTALWIDENSLIDVAVALSVTTNDNIVVDN